MSWSRFKYKYCYVILLADRQCCLEREATHFINTERCYVMLCVLMVLFRDITSYLDHGKNTDVNFKF
jgi:hypothetical protein